MIRPTSSAHPLVAAVATLLWSTAHGHAQGEALPCDQLAHALGGQASTSEQVCKVTLPRPELDVSLIGARLAVPMGLASWAAFAPTPEGDSMVIGDLALRTDELMPVMQGLRDAGIRVTAVHSHMLGESPPMIYMHYQAIGPAEALAQKLHDALAAAEALGGEWAPEDVTPEQAQIAGVPCARIVEALGVDDASVSAGQRFCKATLARPDLVASMRGQPVPPALGFATWFAFTTAERDEAVAVGDFALTQAQVNPVITALLDHDIAVVRLHNHMMFEDPQVMFFHFQARGEPIALAKGLRAGLTAAEGATEATASGQP